MLILRLWLVAASIVFASANAHALQSKYMQCVVNQMAGDDRYAGVSAAVIFCNQVFPCPLKRHVWGASFPETWMDGRTGVRHCEG